MRRNFNLKPKQAQREYINGRKSKGKKTRYWLICFPCRFEDEHARQSGEHS